MKTDPAKKTSHLPVPNGSTSDDPPRSGATASQALFKRILVPVDFSDCSLRALECAATLARKFRARLILLHVLEPACPGDYLNPVAVDAANGSLIGTAREQLAKATRQAGAQGLIAETLVRMGRAQSDIADTAKAIGAELIVMGTRGAGGLDQVLLGGTAERVLRQAPCPVLTVPPAKR